MSIIEEKLSYLDSLRLGSGSHPAPNKGLVNACVMEAVAYVTGLPWSDHPDCVSPVIGQFLRSWNDSLPDDDRQMLKPYIVRVVGTNTGKKDDETRAWMLTDWLARECAPAFLRLAGKTAEAELMEQLSPLDSASAARSAQPTIDRGRAAWDAAWDAAWAAARAALTPTVTELQTSALLLLDRMIEVGKAGRPSETVA